MRNRILGILQVETKRMRTVVAVGGGRERECWPGSGLSIILAVGRRWAVMRILSKLIRNRIII